MTLKIWICTDHTRLYLVIRRHPRAIYPRRTMYFSNSVQHYLINCILITQKN